VEMNAAAPNEASPIEKTVHEPLVERAMPSSEEDVAEHAQEDDVGSPKAGQDAGDSDRATVPELPAKTREEEEAERQQAAEEAKKKEDEDAIDVYRQRVLARKAAEKQRREEQEAADKERKRRSDCARSFWATQVNPSRSSSFPEAPSRNPGTQRWPA